MLFSVDLSTRSAGRSSLIPSLPGALLSAPAGGTEQVQVRFSIPYRCNFGQHVRIIGSAQQLGAWELEGALPMQWTEGDVWTADVSLPKE